MLNSDSVLGYRRPAMLGGEASADPGALTIRWYGTSNYELNFRDRVVLLDTFYDRGPRMRGLGFRPDEVVRADAVSRGPRPSATMHRSRSAGGRPDESADLDHRRAAPILLICVSLTSARHRLASMTERFSTRRPSVSPSVSYGRFWLIFTPKHRSEQPPDRD